MKTLLKVVLACIVVVVVLLGAAIAYVMLAFDPNSYKPQLEQAARDQGMELDIAGDLGWSLWPNLAITLGETRFAGEDYGIKPSSLQEASLVLSWSDLLRKRIAVKALTIDSADLHLTSTDIGAAIAATPATGDQPIEGTAPDGQAFSLAVDRFTIANSRVRLDQDDAPLLLDNIELATRGVNVEGNTFPFSLGFRYHQEDSETLEVAINATVSYDQAGEKLGLEDSVIEIAGLLPATLRLAMEANADLAAESARIDNLVIDLDDARLTGNAALGYGTPMTLALELAGTELDLDQLLATEGDGIILSNPKLRLSGRDRTLTVENISAGLFDGNLSGSGVVDAGSATPVLRFAASLDNIDMKAALEQFADDLDLTGTLTMSVEGNTRGQQADDLLSNLQAAGNFQASGLHLGNVNLEQSYCELAALVERGERRQNWPVGTSLNDLTGNFHLQGTVLHLDDYSTGLGNIGLRGEGTIDFDRESFDIRAITRLDGDRTSADGCEVKSTRVRDKDIPFVCSDRFADAGAGSCKPDPDFVRTLLQNELIDRLGGDEEGEDSLENRLRGLLGR